MPPKRDSLESNETGTESAEITEVVGSQEPQYVAIEELKDKLTVSESIFRALKVNYDWADGLVMTEEEFMKAYDNWLSNPINGRG